MPLTQLTDGEIEVVVSLYEQDAAKKSLIPFCKYIRPDKISDVDGQRVEGYQEAPHLTKLAKRLEAVERSIRERTNECRFLMVFMPPRHGKSETGSIQFPALFLGQNPQKAVIEAGHTEALARGFSRAARDTIQGDEYRRLFPKHRINADVSSNTRWQLMGKLDKRSSMIAAGVGGAITGEGADLIVVDDPVKTAQDAYSIVKRDALWTWWTTTLRTRLNPGGAIVLIMTRWHYDDLAGRLIKAAEDDPEADQWEVLSLQAIDEEGAPLWPERYDLRALQQVRATMGSRMFECLYQQRPSRAEGNIFKRSWWKFFDVHKLPTVFDDIIQVWDTAFETSDDNSFTVCQTWAKSKNRLLLLDQWRGRVKWPDLRRQVDVQFTRHRPTKILIEKKASGISLLQELDETTIYPIEAIEVGRASKVVRANAVTGTIEAGRVELPKEGQAPWVRDFLDELSEFDAGIFDDQVDAAVHAITYLAFKADPSYDVGSAGGHRAY